MMNLPGLLLRAQCHRTVVFSWSSVGLSRRPSASRGYATQRSGFDASSLPHSLDTKTNILGGRQAGRDSVGPFQLGGSQSFGDEKVKKWAELSTSGKVQRTTARTTNFAVIILGAGLSVVLIYCLTSELFSKNSPTVLHDDACKRIKASPQVSRYIEGPLTFHNSPPSLHRPRHRNHHVTSQLIIDSRGREHMILNFYVQGRAPGSAPAVPDSYFDAVNEWVQAKAADLTELTWDGAVEWTKAQSTYTWNESKRLFKYLIGDPAPRSLPPPVPLSTTEQVQTHPGKSNAWQLTGMFSSLRGAKAGSTEQVLNAEDKTFTEGEVHVDLVRNNDGYFVYRYLLIELPSSSSRNPVRVFVERGPGVRDQEPVMRWNKGS